MTWENFNNAITAAADPRPGHISAICVTYDTNPENRWYAGSSAEMAGRVAPLAPLTAVAADSRVRATRWAF